jgi:hypothetical protein
MKSVHCPQEETHLTSLDARFHRHDVIPAQAGIQEFAQILDRSHGSFFSPPDEFFPSFATFAERRDLMADSDHDDDFSAP